MKSGFSIVFSGLLIFCVLSCPAVAQDRIQAYVSPDGKILFTNQTDAGVFPLNAAATLSTPAFTEAVEGSPALHALIESISGNNGVDPNLVRAVVKTESNFNRWAVSSKGALGLMQLIPGTGARYGVRDFFDPQQNIEGGVKYLRFLLDKFNNDLTLSLAAYNAGENLVEKLGRIPPIPETQEYVRRVLTIYQKNPAASSTVAMATAQPASVQAPEIPKIVRTVDERGVVRYSNIEPQK
jgi:soluble lytic murein transglycosylase-like protein